MRGFRIARTDRLRGALRITLLLAALAAPAACENVTVGPPEFPIRNHH